MSSPKDLWRDRFDHYRLTGGGTLLYSTVPYHNFYEASQEARDYNFGEGPAEKMSPPTVNDLNSLTWWSLDRPKRLRVIRRMREQYLNEILSFRKKKKRVNFIEPVTLID